MLVLFRYHRFLASEIKFFIGKLLCKIFQLLTRKYLLWVCWQYQTKQYELLMHKKSAGENLFYNIVQFGLWKCCSTVGFQSGSTYVLSIIILSVNIVYITLCDLPYIPQKPLMLLEYEYIDDRVTFPCFAVNIHYLYFTTRLYIWQQTWSHHRQCFVVAWSNTVMYFLHRYKQEVYADTMDKADCIECRREHAN